MFTAVEDFATDGIAAPVLAADMNGDGLSDLILNQPLSASFGVQLSNADSTLRAPVYYAPAAISPDAVLSAEASGDFNGDGRNDLAVISTVFTFTSTGQSTSTLTIFLNNGAGVLKEGPSYVLDPVPANENAPLLVAGELDGDHRADLAVVYRSASGKVNPYYATGNGSFRKGGTFAAGPYPAAAAIGKLTFSGYGDIAVTTQKGVVILAGSSTGTFTAGGTIVYPYPVPPFGAGAQLILADLDKDGNLDIAFTDTDFVDVFWGKGTGQFTGPDVFSVPAFPVALLAADTSGSGREDLISASQDASVFILANEGSRHFRAVSNTHSPLASGIVADDFNRDGRQDIAVVNTPTCKAPCNGAVTVFPGTGSTYFAPGKRYTIGMHGTGIATGDLNGDGVPDLVITNATAGDNADTSVLLGLQSGGFAAPLNITLGSLSSEAFLVDMNKDGKLDLVEDGGVALGRGNGTFEALKPFPGGLGFGQPYPTAFSMHLAVGDVNGDGIPDVVASFVPPGMSAFASEVFVLQGDGKGNFAANQLDDANLLVQQVVGIAIASLRKGAAPDIILANNIVDANAGNAINAVVFKGQGAGNFVENTASMVNMDAGSSGTIAIQDFNHDGFPDIGMISGDHFAVALGKGDGTFTSPLPSTFPVTSATQTNPAAGMAVADFNNDGWPDVMVTNNSGIARLYDHPVPLVSTGSLTWGSSASKVVTVKNTLNYAEALSATLPDPSQSRFRITANSCNTSLAPGATCSVTVEYASSGLPAADTLYIRANGSFVASVALSGN